MQIKIDWLSIIFETQVGQILRNSFLRRMSFVLIFESNEKPIKVKLISGNLIIFEILGHNKYLYEVFVLRELLIKKSGRVIIIKEFSLFFVHF